MERRAGDSSLEDCSWQFWAAPRRHAADGGDGAVPAPSPVVRALPLVGIGVAVDEATGRAFVTQERGAVAVLDAGSGALLRTTAVGAGGQAAPVAVDAVSGRVFVVTRDTVATLDARSGALLHTTRLAFPSAVAVAPALGRVYVAAQGGVAILDARTGALLRTTRTPLSPAYSPYTIATDARTGGVYEATENPSTTIITALDARTGRVRHMTQVGGAGPAAVVVAARAGRVFVVPGDMLDASGRIVRRDIGGSEGYGDGAAVDERAGRVFIPEGGNAFVDVLDARSGATVREADVGQIPIGRPAVDEGAGRGGPMSWCRASRIRTATR